MANEIYYSGAGDYTLSATLYRTIQLLLADRASLWNHPALVYLGDLAQSSSAAIQAPQFGLDGYDEMGAVAENASTSNTALTDASDTVTIARQAIQRQMSDLAVIVNSVGLDPVRLASSMVGEAQMRFTSMVTALSANFSQSVGTSGVDMSVDDFMDAGITLDLQAVGPARIAVLHPRQIGDLKQSLRGETGPLAFVPATAEMIAAKGPGYQGMLLGVDIFSSTKVATANAAADRDGFMFARGAILWADASQPLNIPGLQEASFGKIRVGFERDEAGALTKVVGNYFVGVAEGQDLMACRIVTDA